MVNWQRGVMRLMRIANHEIAVTRVEDLTDRYRRIRFTGHALLAELSDVFPTLWVRLWFPHPEKGAGHLSQRGYTFVDIDVGSGSFSLDFVLHGDDGPDAELAEATASPEPMRHVRGGPSNGSIGPATRWAVQARPGTTIEAALTPARVDLPADTKHLVLLGDITALPAMNSWLAWTPAEAEVTLVVEDDGDDADSLPRAEHENAKWTWVRSSGSRGTALADHVRSRDLDTAGLYVWAAGERGLVKSVRSVLRDSLGLERKRHFSQVYWFAHKPFG